MCYEIRWLDEAQNIVYAYFPPDTQWEDYLDCGIAFQFFAQEKPNELVFLVIDILEAPFRIPPNLFTDLRRFVNDGNIHIPNWGMTIIVDRAENQQLLSSILFFLNIFTKKFASTNTLDEAVQHINKRKDLVVHQVVYY